MAVTCLKCGMENRGTGRFCAKCGERLPVNGGATGADDQAGISLPWMEGVRERATKSTERLGEGQLSEPDARLSPEEDVQDSNGQGAEISGISGTPGVTETDSLESSKPETLGPPDEAPPRWVVSILEPESGEPSAPIRAAGDYEPEELAHIMPWLHGEKAEAGPSATGPGSPGLPPWLGNVTVQETLQSASTDSSSTLQEGEELGIEEIEPFVPPELEAARPAVTTKPQDRLPAWLRKVAPEEASTKEAIPAVEDQEMPPMRRETPVRPPRAGAVEALSALVQPSIEASLPNIALGSGSDTPAATGPKPHVEKRMGVRGWLFPDGLIYITILVALLTVLIGRPPFGDVSAPTAKDVQQFYNAVEAAPREKPVLVVYDWDATRSAEMSLLSEATMRHIMSRRLRFVTISTAPQGPGFAQQITGELESEYGYEYGRDYLVLGYLPGNEAALRALITGFSQTLPLDYERSRSINSYGLMQGGALRGIEDFGLIVNLASEEAELRNWIEQVAARTSVPLVAAVPQSLEPLARPYRGVANVGLDAIVAGPTGALQYSKLLELGGRNTGSSIATGSLIDRLHAQSVAQLLMGFFILAALVRLGSKGVMRRN